MDCNSNIEIAQILIRGALLLTVSAAGIFSIYLGWRLYRDAVVSKTIGAIEAPSFKLRFSAASPGVVLAGFGAYLVLAVAQHRFETETAAPIATKSSMSSSHPGVCRSLDAPSTRYSHQPVERTSGAYVVLAQAPTGASAIKPTQEPFECALWKRKTKYLGGANGSGAAGLDNDLAKIIGLVDASPSTTDEERRSKRRALQVLGDLRVLAADSMEAEKRGVGR
jgi:hypothetical protein